MLNRKTIINGKKIELSEKEQTCVADFHKSRIAFAIIFSENGYTLAINKKDAREHRVYLKKDYNISDEEFETLIRGYIKPGKINFYMTSHFIKIPTNILNEDILNELFSIALNEYGDGEYIIGNGLLVEEPGKEWQPLEILDKYLIEENNIKRLKK